MGSESLWKKLQRVPAPLPLREDPSRRGCHEVGPYLATLAPWSWTSLRPELPEINVCCFLAPRAMACDHTGQTKILRKHSPLSVATISSYLF